MTQTTEHATHTPGTFDALIESGAGIGYTHIPSEIRHQARAALAQARADGR